MLTTIAAAALLPRALLLSPRPSPPSLALAALPLPVSRQRLRQSSSFHWFTGSPSYPRALVLVASAGPSFDGLDSFSRSRRHASKGSVILNLVQEIEPLDMSVIQKDVPANTVDAMKRTISGMLGLLPSDQFHVQVESFWGSLSKLLISSMKTGYTLHNAEYRLCLERNLDIHEEHPENGTSEIVEDGSQETLGDRSPSMFSSTGGNDAHCHPKKNEGEVLSDNMGFEGLGEVSSEVRDYICYLQSRLDSAEKELHEVKRKSSALQMQQYVGEEKNDLLDYLRSLQPEKVAELSEPTCAGVDETIHSVVHGLLATLSPKIHSKLPTHSENAKGGTNGFGKDDYAEIVENATIQFQPLISVPRDYLARLLFWCMLLGHHIRGLEYRLELMQLLTISCEAETVPWDGDSIS